MDTTVESEIGLAEAALRLGISWNQAWRLVLTGKLVGRKSGRIWLVQTESIAAVEGERRDALRLGAVQPTP